MIDLAGLARLATEHVADLDLPVAAYPVAGTAYDTDAAPLLMGVVNLSRDSSYRDSIAWSTEAAVRRGRTLHAQGAHVVDVGAESTNATTARVDASAQVSALRPVLEGLAEAGVPTSVEGYSPEVIAAGLAAGASVVNLTGSVDDDAVFAAAAEHGASVVVCRTLGDHARALDAEPDRAPGADRTAELLDHFGPRIECARALGVPGISVDPGLGFGFLLDDPTARTRHQTVLLLATFRLRRLGVPVCHALPSAYALFGEHHRAAEPFFAVLAHLGRTGIVRTHEVAAVRAVLEAMGTLDVGS